MLALFLELFKDFLSRLLPGAMEHDVPGVNSALPIPLRQLRRHAWCLLSSIINVRADHLLHYELCNVAHVASWLCDEMTVWRVDRQHNLALWRVDCVTSWPCDDLTVWRVDWYPFPRVATPILSLHTVLPVASVRSLYTSASCTSAQTTLPVEKSREIFILGNDWSGQFFWFL